MTTYYIKKHGVHEIHKTDCVWLPIRKGMVKLGDFDTDEEALQKAKTLYVDLNPCATCCNVRKNKNVTTV
ncbi:MAG: hypothetical protein ACQEST_01775 [Bacteroidota bacterium]